MPKAGKALRDFLGELTVPLLAIVAGLLVGVIFILIAGKNPIAAYGALLESVIGAPHKVGETLVSTVPLIFSGLAIALAFRCGLFNIGVEGQLMVGSLATAWAGVVFGGLPWYLLMPLCILFGVVTGAAWAGISGLLKAYRGVHEVINSIMLNYTALFLTHYLMTEHFRDATGKAGSPPMAEAALFAQGLIPGSRLHAGLFLALFVAFLAWVFLWKTPWGYEIRAVGFAPGAAEYGGISVKWNIVLAMLISGALAGMAGAVQTMAISGKFPDQSSFSGYGLDGIAVALVGRNHPGGVVLAALLFAALDYGGRNMQAVAEVPKAVIMVVQGAIIFFVAAEGIWRMMKNRKPKAEVKTA